MKTYYFIRHGASLADTGELELHGGNAPATVEDIPLSERGKKEAAKCAEFFARLGNIQAIFSSPLGRTLDTAKIISERTGADITLLPEVREVDFSGVFEFFKRGASKSRIKISPKDLPYNVFRALMMASSNFFFFTWLFGNAPGNESIEQVRERLEYAFGILDESPFERIIVASHGFFITYLAAYLIQNKPEDIFQIKSGLWVPNCSVTKVTSNRGELRMKYFASGNYEKIS